jgi:membrane-associated phospholipid phosphatase
VRALIVAAVLVAEALLVLLPLARPRPAPGRTMAGDPAAGKTAAEDATAEDAAEAVGRTLGAGAVLVAALVPFLLLMLVVAAEVDAVTDFDAEVGSDAHRAVLDSPALLTAAHAATDLGDARVRIGLAALAAAVLLLRRNRRAAIFVLVTVTVGAAANPLLKGIVDRARPVLPDPVAHAAGSSFPSGHAMGAAVLYIVLLLVAAPALARRLRVAAATLTVLLIVAVAASRVLLGVHYVSDVISGCFAGAAWVALATLAFRGWHRVVV